MPGQVWEADAIGTALAWLKEHPYVVEGFGHESHVSGVLEAPWPHLIVEPGEGGGSYGRVEWATSPDVALVVVGDPAGVAGMHACWQLLVRASAALMQMEGHITDTTIVSAVAMTTGPVPQDLTTGQVRWRATFAVTVHPRF